MTYTTHDKGQRRLQKRDIWECVVMESQDSRHSKEVGLSFDITVHEKLGLSLPRFEGGGYLECLAVRNSRLVQDLGID